MPSHLNSALTSAFKAKHRLRGTARALCTRPHWRTSGVGAEYERNTSGIQPKHKRGLPNLVACSWLAARIPLLLTTVAASRTLGRSSRACLCARKTTPQGNAEPDQCEVVLAQAACLSLRVLQPFLNIFYATGHYQLTVVLQDDEVFAARSGLQAFDSLQVYEDGPADAQK